MHTWLRIWLSKCCLFQWSDWLTVKMAEWLAICLLECLKSRVSGCVTLEMVEWVEWLHDVCFPSYRCIILFDWLTELLTGSLINYLAIAVSIYIISFLLPFPFMLLPSFPLLFTTNAKLFPQFLISFLRHTPRSSLLSFAYSDFITQYYFHPSWLLRAPPPPLLLFLLLLVAVSYGEDKLSYCKRL